MYTEINTFFDGIFDKRQRVLAFSLVVATVLITLFLTYTKEDVRQRFITEQQLTITKGNNGVLIGTNNHATYLLLPDTYFMLPKVHSCDVNTLSLQDFTTWCSPYNEPKQY